MAAKKAAKKKARRPAAKKNAKIGPKMTAAQRLALARSLGLSPLPRDKSAEARKARALGKALGLRKKNATMTRTLAVAAAKDAANRQMRKAGRTAWSRSDYNLYVRTFDKLWPAKYDVVGGPHYRNPRAKKAAAKKNPTALRSAKKLVQRFIGKATGKVTKAKHPGLKKGTVLAKLVKLDYLKLRNPNLEGGMIAWKGAERPTVASKPNGRQYFFVGGNQNLNAVPPIRKANGKPGLVDLGEVLQLGYTARKHVDDYRLQGYYHKLGEENGRRPRLHYDPRRKQMYFAGGDYRTQPEGICN